MAATLPVAEDLEGHVPAGAADKPRGHDSSDKLEDLLQTPESRLQRLEIIEQEGEAIDPSGLIGTPARETRWARSNSSGLCSNCVQPYSVLYCHAGGMGCAKEVKSGLLDETILSLLSSYVSVTGILRCMGDHGCFDTSQ